MLLFCEECGEKYIIENTESSDQPIRFECRNCGEMITVPVQADK
jgi:predicted RNA-binding Zn-ribbon protein involved in translation (DUF1610 family)